MQKTFFRRYHKFQRRGPEVVYWDNEPKCGPILQELTRLWKQLANNQHHEDRQT
jgi:hypothetical protein